MPVKQLVPDYSHIAAQGEIWGDTVSQLGDLAADTFYKYQGIKRDENETNQLRSMIKQTFMDPQNMEMYGLEKSEAKALVSKLQNMDKPELTQVLQNFRIYDTLGAKEKIGMPNPFAPTDVFKKAIEIEINRKHGADVSQAAKMAAQGGAVQYPGGQLGAPGEPPPQTTMQGPPAPTGPAGSESQFLDRFSQLAPEGATAKEALGTPAGAAVKARAKEQENPIDHAMKMADARIKLLNEKIKEAELKKKTSPDASIDVPNFNQIQDDYRTYSQKVQSLEEVVESTKQEKGPMHDATVAAEANLAAMKEMQKAFKKAIIDISKKAKVQSHLSQGPEKAEQARQQVFRGANIQKGVEPVSGATPEEAFQSGRRWNEINQGVGSPVPLPGMMQSQISSESPSVTAPLSIIGNRPPGQTGGTAGSSSAQAQLNAELAKLRAAGQSPEVIEAYRMKREQELGLR